ncbi:HAD family hydrolase [Sanguibacter sp. YZGR15]|uniref:HAD family hydrolase n=1 Tax=Sanguibacter suaedae TaxID=2795737 RepID=A0A934MAQ0_9MICO|nr:HAD family hydrolase [Sanguibacter suaedae]
MPLLGGQVDGVLFDVDDTLVDTRSAFGVAMRRIAETYLPDLPADRHDEVLVHWRRDALGHYRAYTRGETTFRAQRLARANLLQEEFGGAPVPDEAFEEWDAVFEGAFQDGWAAHAEAASCVADLAAHGLKVGALSNAAFDYQVLKLERAGLGDVPMLVGVDTLGVGKPDPRVFLEACRLLGTEPHRTVYVGDELDVDARGALAAGLRAVWVDRPGARRGGPHLEDPALAEAEGIVVVPSLREVVGMLGVDA